MIVILDLDGTLARVGLDLREVKREVDEEFARRGVDVASEAGIVEKIAIGSAALGDGALARTLRARLEAVELEAAAGAAPLEGVREALELMRERGHTLAVLSRNCRPAVELCLRRARLEGLFAAVVTRDDAPPKPLPDGVRRIVRELGGGPAVMVGDSVYDMRAGRRAGVATVGVLCGSSPPAELEAAGADHVIPDVTHLPGLLARLSCRPHGNP